MNFERKQGSRALEDMEMLNFIDSLHEETVSDDLEEVAEHLSKIYAGEGSADPKREGCAFYIGFKNGAKWQKQQDQSTIELVEDHAMLAGMEKAENLKKLADAMYNAAQNMTTDASRLRKAMDEYHQYVIQEYYDNTYGK